MPGMALSIQWVFSMHAMGARAEGGVMKKRRSKQKPGAGTEVRDTDTLSPVRKK